MIDDAVARPWYREPWPWLLMAGPLAVIVAGMATLWLAMRSDDGLVADDYYKRGLAINQTLARGDLAARLGYRAGVTFDADGRRVTVALSGGAPLPPHVVLRLAHPTRAGMDQVVTLRASAAGTYSGELRQPATGRRIVILEDFKRTWRLSADAAGAAGITLTLAPN